MRSHVSISKFRGLALVALLATSGLFLGESFARTKRATSLSKSSTPNATFPASETTVTTATGKKTPVTTSPTAPDAPSPAASGTLSPANPTITYTDTLITNTSGSVFGAPICTVPNTCSDFTLRSEEHTSELQSLTNL